MSCYGVHYSPGRWALEEASWAGLAGRRRSCLALIGRDLRTTIQSPIHHVPSVPHTAHRYQKPIHAEPSALHSPTRKSVAGRQCASHSCMSCRVAYPLIMCRRSLITDVESRPPSTSRRGYLAAAAALACSRQSPSYEQYRGCQLACLCQASLLKPNRRCQTSRPRSSRPRSSRPGE